MPWWKQLLISCLLVIFAVGLPLFLAAPPTEQPIEAEPSATPTASAEPSLPKVCLDGETTFTALMDGEVCNVSMAQYLPAVVAAEMPASFHSEALKAQAVAARTFILYKMSHPTAAHPEAAVCTEAACCKAYSDENDLRVLWGRDYREFAEKITSAVAETDGEYIIYEGEIIQSVFHASSYGQTESGENIWSGAPYLMSVETPETDETVRELTVEVRVPPEAFAEALSGSGVLLSGDPWTWVGDRHLNSAGRVDCIKVGGTEIPGTEMRTVFGLRSSNFELAYDGTDFVFTVRGYGHGVGMSQQGANLLAEEGKSYKEILLHYYSGVEMVTAEKNYPRSADDN